MSFPNFKDKHDKTALFSPEDFIRYARSRNLYKADLPENMILCYHKPLMKIIEGRTDFERLDRVFKHKEKNLGIVGDFGIGSPAAAVEMEELIARGAKNFVSLGFAGALQNEAKVGDHFIIDRAIRDEGTSHHYLPAEKYISASEKLIAFYEDFFKKEKIPYKKGTTWTTDAVYRETKEEISAYKNEGVLSVDMEASALFSVAKFRSVDCVGLFVASDLLKEGKDWNPKFHLAKKNLEELFEKLLLAF